MRIFKQKPKLVEAIQYKGTKDSIEECKEFCNNKTEKGQRDTLVIKTSKGKKIAITNSWITKNDEGNLTLYSKKEFEENFVEATENEEEE